MDEIATKIKKKNFILGIGVGTYSSEVLASAASIHKNMLQTYTFPDEKALATTAEKIQSSYNTLYFGNSVIKIQSTCFS